MMHPLNIEASPRPWWKFWARRPKTWHVVLTCDDGSPNMLIYMGSRPETLGGEGCRYYGPGSGWSGW
jgi:hypothetical protein